MARLHNFLKIFSVLFPFTDFLYILQLEEYSSKRLLKWLPRFFLRRNFQKREHLILTQRAIFEFVASIALYISIVVAFCIMFRSRIFVLLLLQVGLIICIPILVLLVNTFFVLYYELPKQKIREHATQKIKNSGVKVIAIAGSYGKTTTKNFIQQLVKHSYKTQMIPGNINTPLGIAVWILKSFDVNAELLIAEVDAYEIGEIAKSCDILNADIAVLTNIGDQHLERFGNREKLAQALSEVFTHSKSTALRICTEITKQELMNFLPSDSNITTISEQPVLMYKSTVVPSISVSDSNKINLQFALKVAETLDIKKDFVLDSIKVLALPERRQQISMLFGFDAIDDSYNISFTTAKAGILAAKTYAAQKKKKLLVITAGIPELSNENRSKNKELGALLDANAEFTIILNSMFAQEIASGFASKKSIICPSLMTVITDVLPQYNKDDWVLLLQPELNDLYY